MSLSLVRLMYDMLSFNAFLSSLVRDVIINEW